MASLRLLSAGAAQAVSERVIAEFSRDTGAQVVADFGAVGAMKSRVIAGEAVDVVILTRAMIDELAAAGLVDAATQLDLGTVATGIAVRSGTPAPVVATSDELRRAALASSVVVCPDPATATAGKVVMASLEKLGIASDMQARMRFFPNGYAAMKWLSTSDDERALGITQVTEILPNRGVTYVGPLPPELQVKTLYSGAVASRASEGDLARTFMRRFGAPSARRMLAEAGYEVH